MVTVLVLPVNPSLPPWAPLRHRINISVNNDSEETLHCRLTYTDTHSGPLLTVPPRTNVVLCLCQTLTFYRSGDMACYTRYVFRHCVLQLYDRHQMYGDRDLSTTEPNEELDLYTVLRLNHDSPEDYVVQRHYSLL